MLNSKSRETEKTLFKIIGPLPIGTKVKVFDRRYKKGWYIGKVLKYFSYSSNYSNEWGRTVDSPIGLKYKRFSYVMVDCQKSSNFQRRYSSTNVRMEVIEE